jgi:hypothetical protein
VQDQLDRGSSDSRKLSKQAIIFSVAADPEPDEIIAVADRKRPIMQTNANRPIAAGLL